ncbi:hypothetical protein NL676_009444 [Syzygium grande]|nr:hypothetical protein NL676_009444 [Syzygium grande]
MFYISMNDIVRDSNAADDDDPAPAGALPLPPPRSEEPGEGSGHRLSSGFIAFFTFVSEKHERMCVTERRKWSASGACRGAHMGMGAHADKVLGQNPRRETVRR